MVDTVATVQDGQLGPGTLKIGTVGSQIDCSCLLNNAKIVATVDQTDPTTKLCGDVRRGTRKYTFALQGNVDTDIADAAGLFAISQSGKGTEQAFEYVPSTAEATSATGTLVLDPLDFGADEMGADLTSDFEWGIVGDVAYTFGVLLAADTEDTDVA
jgi:hypothetical protein